jgi:hypothetical protein
MVRRKPEHFVACLGIWETATEEPTLLGVNNLLEGSRCPAIVLEPKLLDMHQRTITSEPSSAFSWLAWPPRQWPDPNHPRPSTGSGCFSPLSLGRWPRAFVVRQYAKAKDLGCIVLDAAGRVRAVGWCDGPRRELSVHAAQGETLPSIEEMVVTALPLERFTSKTARRRTMAYQPPGQEH